MKPAIIAERTIQMPRPIKRVYPVSEMAHLWAAYNRGDSTLDHARSGKDYEGARFTGTTFYSEGDVSAVQRVAKSKARYVLAVPGRRHGVSDAAAEGNGRLIILPYSAIGTRYQQGTLRASALDSADLDLRTVVKALIAGNVLHHVTEARWLARQERLSFPALLREVLDENETTLLSQMAGRHERARKKQEERERQAREAAEKAANDKNPFMRAMRGVSAAAHAMHRDAQATMGRLFGWMADLCWLAGADISRPWYDGYQYSTFNHAPTLLRYSPKTGTVYTSKGAQFSAEHALRVWPFVRRAWERRDYWQPKGTSDAVLGHYRVDHVTGSGEVKAGCHIVPFWSVAYAWHCITQPGWTPARLIAATNEFVAARPADPSPDLDLMGG